MTKPAKVFGLDERRIWKAEKLNSNTYAIADLGENETQEPPESVSIKLPRDLARQIGRYKQEGETLKSAAERLILEAIATKIASEKKLDFGRNFYKMPFMMPVYIPTASLKRLIEVSFFEDDENIQEIVLGLIEAEIKKMEF